MNRKLALLTLQYTPEGFKGRFHPEKSRLELSIYQLREPSTVQESSGNLTVENRMIMQLNDGQVLASKTFNDERCVKDISDELMKKYDGVAAHNVSGIEWATAFRVASAERIIYEYFLSSK